MNTQQRAIIGVVIIAGFIFFQSKSAESLTTSDIQPIIDKTSEAFDIAQAKVFNVIPDDDDEPLGPDPDVNKCICKGTGQYERPDLPGSGKMVDCPYHSVSSPAPVANEVEVLEMRTYCPTTVPAMLTPGEFVIRKSAVDKETTQIQKKNYRRPLLWFLRKR